MSSMSSTSTPKALALPGLGLPLNHYDMNNNTRFPNALSAEDLGGYRATMPLLTLREITMLQIMQQIASKPDWSTKVFNEEIVARWTTEAISNTANNANGTAVSSQMMSNIVEELRHKAEQFKETGYFTAYDLCTISDTALSATFSESLNEAVRVLEDVPENLKDWHPGSNGKVLDLVHPSLFPLVYGRTRVLCDGEKAGLDDTVRFCGRGSVIPKPAGEDDRDQYSYFGSWYFRGPAYSTKFQWLPCEVDISGRNAR